tara:strand:- start:198 stop:365 length:168 start_codon:yes stop_codon:yes gene_type:complete
MITVDATILFRDKASTRSIGDKDCNQRQTSGNSDVEDFDIETKSGKGGDFFYEQR